MTRHRITLQGRDWSQPQPARRESPQWAAWERTQSLSLLPWLIAGIVAGVVFALAF